MPFEIEIRELGFTFTKNYSLEGYKKHFVEHARLSALEVSVLSPSSGDFSFLESTIIYISADGLPELEIARKNDEPGDFGHFISLDVNDYDLRDYIKKDEFILKVKIVFDEIILQDHEINIRSVFDIDARVMGV